MSREPNITETCPDEPEAIVIGAGPAGASAAIALAKRGVQTVFLESRSFPRWKVCGCCLGSMGQDALTRLCGEGILREMGAVPLSRTRLQWKGQTRTMRTASLSCVSRVSMDDVLASKAIELGATIHWNSHAAIERTGGANGRASVRVRSDGGERVVRPRVVLLACGLRSASCDPEKARVHKHSRIGLGARGGRVPSWLERGELVMLVARDGYVGCVLDEEGAPTWGAAVRTGAIREAGSPGACIERMLREAGAPLCDAGDLEWRGTPALTRRARPQSARVYRVGDASGYVEPITGEGMSWAIASGERAGEVVAAALAQGREANEGAWARARRDLLRAHERRCGWIARGVRSGMVMRAACALLPSQRALGPSVMARLIGGPVREVSA